MNMNIIHNINYSRLYAYITLVISLAIVVFYVYVLKQAYNPINPLLSFADVIHVFVAFAIMLMMFTLDDNSLLRIFYIIAALSAMFLG